jgi:MFS family permease
MHAPRTARRRFLGWDTVVGGAGLQLVQVALFFYVYGVYVVAWDAEMGWSRTATSAGYAIVTLIMGGLGLAQGHVLERIGVRRVVFAGLALLAGGLLATSFATQLIHLYAAMVLVGLGVAASGYLSIATAIVPWFVRRRSTAVALMSLGLSVGGLGVPLVAGMIEDSGWRVALRASAVVVALAAVPLAVLMRRPPAAYGQAPDGEPSMRAAVARPADPTPHGHDFTVAQALRTRAFWLLSIGHGVSLLVMNGISVHLVPHLVDGVGLSLAAAAAMVTALTLASGVGQLAGGPLGDRLDKRRAASLSMWVHVGALAVWASTDSNLAVLAAAVAHGLAWGVRGPLMTSIRADYFGARHFASVMGASMLVFTVGQLVGPILAGSMADRYGDYRSAFVLMAALAASASVAFWWATPPRGPDRRRDPSVLVRSSGPAAGTATARAARRRPRSPRA